MEVVEVECAGSGTWTWASVLGRHVNTRHVSVVPTCIGMHKIFHESKTPFLLIDTLFCFGSHWKHIFRTFVSLCNWKKEIYVSLEARTHWNVPKWQIRHSPSIIQWIYLGFCEFISAALNLLLFFMLFILRQSGIFYYYYFFFYKSCKI